MHYKVIPIHSRCRTWPARRRLLAPLSLRPALPETWAGDLKSSTREIKMGVRGMFETRELTVDSARNSNA